MFPGTTASPFNWPGWAHPTLRTLLLGRELTNKRGKSIDVAIGMPLSAAAVTDASGDYLRRRAYFLGHRTRRTIHLPRVPRRVTPVAKAAPVLALEQNIRDLSNERLLYSAGQYRVFAAPAFELPVVMPEIGRLREVTFRAAGEGTGLNHDLDRFDDEYLHIFLWNSVSREIVGAYRLGAIDRVATKAGLADLYTRTLFHFGSDFLKRVTPGIELGRSFVRVEYQRRPQPLLYLWRAIAAYVVRYPHYRYLFGPVSISSSYLHGSRKLIVDYFRVNRTSKVPVRARHPFGLRYSNAHSICASVRGISELDAIVSDLEIDGKGLPVLLRHYLGLGAEIIDFNVDRAFADALDALIVVDLLTAPVASLAKFMGRQELSNYLAHHGQTQ